MEDLLNDHNIMCWCICLKDNNVRFQHMQQELDRVKLLAHVNFHRPERSEQGGEIGCWLSHRYCLTECHKQKKHALIFEDDVIFTENYANEMATVNRALCINGWEIIRLGGVVWYYLHESPLKHMWSVKSNATHAIIINYNLICNLINDKLFDPIMYKTLGLGGGIDDFYKNNDFNDYILKDVICYQKSFGEPIKNQWYYFTLFQKLYTNKYLFITFQKMTNGIAWYLRILPICVQTWINPFILISNLNICLDYLFSSR